YLIAAASWRWIFLINLPIGAFVLALSARHVPESRDPASSGRVDAGGAALATAALALLTYGLIDGPARGWASPPVAASLGGGAILALLFVARERRSSAPLLPLGMFSNRQFAVTNAVTFVVYAGLGGVLFLLPATLQIVDGYSPLASGVALVPLTVVMLVFSARSGRLAASIGPRLQMTLGPVVVGAGLALLVRAPDSRSYVGGVLPAVLVLAAGLATTVAPLTATALGSAPERHAGLASAVNNDVARIGGLVAVAVLPALGGISGLDYLHPDQLARGFQRAVLIAGGWCVAGGVLAGIGIRNPAAVPGARRGRRRRALSHCALEATPLEETGSGRREAPAAGGAGRPER